MESLQVVFIYATHKENKSESKIQYFKVYTKKTLSIYFTPHIIEEKLIKHNLKALLFINFTFQLT